jgi:hypothetical protein
MKVCETCGGMGHNGYKLLCGACHGTGLINLGPESAAKYAELIAHARAKAARQGWLEEVWEPLSARQQQAQYPRLARKVRRPVKAEARQEVA